LQCREMWHWLQATQQTVMLALVVSMACAYAQLVLPDTPPVHNDTLLRNAPGSHLYSAGTFGPWGRYQLHMVRLSVLPLPPLYESRKGADHGRSHCSSSSSSSVAALCQQQQRS
jgi:hypothetical protein